MIQNIVRRSLLTVSPGLRKGLPYSKDTKDSKPKADCPKVAVVLSGCGFLDGAEIHESVSVLSQLTRKNAIPHIYGLDCRQFHVIDHAKTEEDSSHCRHIISEASRIARHRVQTLEKLVEENECYKAIIFPGGFGVAKNFSDFAEKGTQMEVNPQVKQVLEIFHRAKKPIGLICIAPMLAAKLFVGVRITLGGDDPENWPYRDAIQMAEKLGAIVELKKVHEVCFDKKHNIYSTPAFMYNGEYHEVDDGIGNLITLMLAHIVLEKK